MDLMIRKKMDNIKKCILIKLPNEAKWPDELEELSLLHCTKMIDYVDKQSLSAEKMFHDMIKLILSRIDYTYFSSPGSLDTKLDIYDWFNIKKGLKPVTESDGPSASAISEGIFL